MSESSVMAGLFSLLNRFLLRRLLELKNKEGKKAAKAPAKPQFKKTLPTSAGHSASSPFALASSSTPKPSSGGGIARSKKPTTAKPVKVKESHAQQHKLAPPTTTTTTGSFGGKGLNRPQILEPSDLFSSRSSSSSEDEVMDVPVISTSQRGSGGVRRVGNKAEEGLCNTKVNSPFVCTCCSWVLHHSPKYLHVCLGMCVSSRILHSFIPLLLSGRKKRVRRIQSIPQNDDGQ